MHKIKFSHIYTKMPLDRDQTQLLEVLISNRNELSKEFVRYDTHIDGGGQYQLPSGKVLVLLLFSLQEDTMSWELWTTIRRWTPEKEKYYRSIRGQNVEVVVEEKYNTHAHGCLYI